MGEEMRKMRENPIAELLAPAGDMLKLKTAVHFGADAVYLGGSQFSLRAFAGNFGADELGEAFAYLHAHGRAGYVTVNIFPKNADFGMLGEFLQSLEGMADGVILSDPGLIAFAKQRAPKLSLHLSTQANTLNKYAADFWAKEGISRIVLARELSIPEIREIRDFIPAECELEAFVHGAMCISYSGRCLLSNYLSGRDSNRGECVQACRWKYAISGLTCELTEAGRKGEPLTIEEDGRGSYLLNSKDLCMIRHLGALLDAGISSLKIEGRMKSEYYVGTTVNAYRRVLDGRMTADDGEIELEKTAHRSFTVAYAFGENAETQCTETSKSNQTHDFAALVLGNWERGIIVEMRNRFRRGDELEVLSSGSSDRLTFEVGEMFDEEGNPVEDAKIVQQKLKLEVRIKHAAFSEKESKREQNEFLVLSTLDMLRLRKK